MPSPSTKLRNSLDMVHTLRRKFDQHSGDANEHLMAVTMTLAAGGITPESNPTTPEDVLVYAHFTRMMRLVAEQASADDAAASFHELNDRAADTAERWIRDGVDESELDEFVDIVRQDALRSKELHDQRA